MSEKIVMDERLADGLPFFITICRLSFEAVYGPERKFPPALFIDEKTLEAWVESRQLNIKPLGDKPLDKAKVIYWKSGVESVQYEGVWARADWDGYRSAMVEHSKSASTDKTAEALIEVDADHVINRANIKKTFGDDWGSTWVYLFPASRGVNRSFGSTVEKQCISYICNTDKLRLAPIHLLKIFVNSAPSSTDELDMAIDQLRNQIYLEDEKAKEHLLAKVRTQYECTRFGKAKVTIDDDGRMTAATSSI